MKGRPTPLTRFYIIGQTKQCINNTMSSALKTKKVRLKELSHSIFTKEIIIDHKETRMGKIDTDYEPRTFKNLG